jgi:hypothetical protein
MGADLRISLALPSEPRDPSFTKDSLLTNCFIETSKIGTNYALKRPGFTVGTEGITTGLNRGIFFYNGTVWYVDENTALQGFVPPSAASYSTSYYVITANEDFV